MTGKTRKTSKTPAPKTAAKIETKKPAIARKPRMASAVKAVAPVGSTPAAQVSAEPKPADIASLVAGLVEQLQRGDLASRSAAAIELGQLRDTQATSALVATLRDSTAEIARDAAAVLAGHNEPSVVDALIDVVANGDGYYHSLVRTAAAESLAKLKEPRAVDALLSAVRDPIVGPSVEAIRALGAIGDARTTGVLVAVLRNGDGYFLAPARTAAAEALAKFPEEAARDALQQSATDAAEHPDVRRAAVASLNLVV